MVCIYRKRQHCLGFDSYSVSLINVCNQMSIPSDSDLKFSLGAVFATWIQTTPSSPCKPQFPWNSAERSKESSLNSRYMGECSFTWLKWHSRNVFSFSVPLPTHAKPLLDYILTVILLAQYDCKRTKLNVSQKAVTWQAFYCVSPSSTHWDHYLNP